MESSSNKSELKKEIDALITKMRKNSDTEYASNYVFRKIRTKEKSDLDTHNIVKYFIDNLPLMIESMNSHAFNDTKSIILNTPISKFIGLLEDINKTNSQSLYDNKDVFAFIDTLANELQVETGVEYNNSDLYLIIYDFVWMQIVWAISDGILRESVKMQYDDIAKEPYIFDSNNEKQFFDTDEYAKKRFFRGQTNSKWKLAPSFFRKMTDNHLVDINYLDDNFHRNYLKQKYRKIFNSDKVDYSMLSYIQHSISYSPFLDMTSEFPVALSFALDCIHPVEYNTTESAIYVIEAAEEEILTENKLGNINGLINKFMCLSINKKTSIAKIIAMPIWLEYIKKLFVPTMTIFDCKTNDRMKYQSGVFAFFNNYIIVGDQILLPKPMSNRFKKITISGDRKLKDNLKEWIHINYPQYQNWYLLDPYLFFRVG